MENIARTKVRLLAGLEYQMKGLLHNARFVDAQNETQIPAKEISRPPAVLTPDGSFAYLFLVMVCVFLQIQYVPT